MSNGIRTTNLERSFVIDELIGNITEDEVEKTVRLPLEALANQLAGTGPFIFGNTVYALTKAALDAFTPPNLQMGGVVLNDPNAANNGIYARSGATWVRGRGFPDTLARLTVTGGTANAVQASVNVAVDPGSVFWFGIVPALNNTGPMTLSVSGGLAKPVVNANGDALASAEFPAGRSLILTDEGSEYRLWSDPAVDALLAAAIAAIDDATQLTTPGDGTVSEQKIGDEAVTNPKVASQAIDARTIDGGDARNIRAVLDLNRDGKDGVFVTENIGHRMGLLQYRFDGSRGVILTPWKERWLPALHDCLHPNLLPVGVTARYVRPTGNNANSGADWANAVASLQAAVGLTGNIVFAEGGLKYKLSNLMGTTAINKDLVITFVGQPGLCIPSEDVTWTSVGLSVYQSSALSAPPIAVYAGVSLDTYGELPRYTEVTSQAEVAGMPASWALGAGNTVYVRTGTGVAPTNATVHVCPSYSHRSDGGTGRLHINNAIMVGGFGVRNGLAGSLLSARNSHFAGRNNQNGLQVLDVDLAIFEDCSASDNFNDGFNYTPLNGKSPHFLEINCSGSINRATGTGNATTAHGDCRGYRFNPSGYRNYGIGLADIDTVKSFNVGVVMEGNGVPSSSANGFGIYTDGSVEMWLHGARASGNFANPQIVARGNSIIRYRDCYPIPVAQETAIVAPF